VIAYLVSGRRKISRSISLLRIAFGAITLCFTRTHDFIFAPTLCLWFVLFGTVNIEFPWEARPFRWFIAAGDASYSIYLLHYLVFFWAYWLSRQSLAPLAKLALRALAIWLNPSLLPNLSANLASHREAFHPTRKQARAEPRIDTRSISTECTLPAAFQTAPVSGRIVPSRLPHPRPAGARPQAISNNLRADLRQE
jgi:hypothetical protein